MWSLDSERGTICLASYDKLNNIDDPETGKISEYKFKIYNKKFGYIN